MKKLSGLSVRFHYNTLKKAWRTGYFTKLLSLRIPYPCKLSHIMVQSNMLYLLECRMRGGIVAY
ncbi:hypothetical protein D3C78_828080 [compost metagenome]